MSALRRLGHAVIDGAHGEGAAGGEAGEADGAAGAAGDAPPERLSDDAAIEMVAALWSTVVYLNGQAWRGLRRILRLRPRLPAARRHTRSSLDTVRAYTAAIDTNAINPLAWALGQAYIPFFRLVGPFKSESAGWDVAKGELLRPVLTRGIWANVIFVMTMGLFAWLNIVCLVIESVLMRLRPDLVEDAKKAKHD